ncbi:hypothetical protein MRB53_030834 [Persea americana]|uniref:Uncharacterized protein n=1 Tax=Persea americana TaxID=3435 RepID=A0ACC2KMD0_PERAE|nr:hypothetical protein MRB53_030834 [Persea americana]
MAMSESKQLSLFFFFSLFVAFSLAANVTYDSRSLIIDGQRKLLLSASIHCPRSVPADIVFSSRDVSLEVAKNFLNPGGVSLEVAKNFLNPGLQSGFEKLELLVKDELGITFNMDVPHRSHQIFEGAVTNPHFLKLEGNVSCSYGRAIGQ